MGSISQEESIPYIEGKLEKLAEVEAERKKLEAEAEEKRKAIITEYGDRIDALTQESAALVGDITEAFTEHREYLLDDGGKPRKSVVLRGGELFARFANEALEVDDSLVEKALRKLGRWRDYSKQPPRKLDKAKLKKDKSLVGMLPDEAARFVRNENLIIKLPKLQLEIKRVLNPLRTRLTQSN